MHLRVYSLFSLLALFNLKLLAQPEPSRSSYLDSKTLTEYLWGKENFYDTNYIKLRDWKKKYFPFSFGAHNWWHYDCDRYIYGDGYGIDPRKGTYRYEASFFPSFKLESSETISEVGIYSQLRFRDNNDKMRPFYDHSYWWHEAYIYTKTNIGTFKAGMMSKHFGIPFDMSWWEGVPWFDGMKGDPDWGISWEHSWKRGDHWSFTAALQYYFHENGINGSLNGADPESFVGLNEENTVNLRFLPEYRFSKNWSLGWGFSTQLGQISGSENFPGVDNYQYVWGTDIKLTYKNLSIWAEYIDSYGAISPRHYLSKGPSKRINSVRGGINWQLGPVMARVTASQGWAHDPDGKQWIFDPGISVRITENVTLYAEYVKWILEDQYKVESRYNDGFEIVLVWTF